jgi:predicted amidohydrolase YtcJ
MKKILIGLMVVSMHAAMAEHKAFVGAKIYDGENYLNADTLIVQDGVIADLGLRESLAKKVATATKVIDLKGSRVLPGFIESHAHLISLGQSKINVDFRGLTLKEIVSTLKERVNKEAPGTWIVGRNWDQNAWENKKYPSAAILDAVTSAHPVFLKRVDGHAAWVNTVALKKAGIDRQSKDPAGGKIERNRSLEPSGILIDNAMSMITRNFYVTCSSPATKP